MSLYRVLGGLALLLAVAVRFSGVLDQPSAVIPRSVPAWTLVYAKHVGPFKNVPGAIKALQEELAKVAITPISTVGVYFDDPKLVDESQMRWFAGAMVGPEAAGGLAVLGDEVKVLQVPAASAQVVTFPYRSPLTFLFAPSRVYPLLKGLSLTAPPVEFYNPDQIEFVWFTDRSVANTFHWDEPTEGK